MHSIRKAVIPAAGRGTRSLPASKVVAKELLPIAGKPLIQYAVEEAAASGIETVILVLSEEKSLVAEHFRKNSQLERLLISEGKAELAQSLCKLSELAEIKIAIQKSPHGLADAVRAAQPWIFDEPFAVILPDVLIDAAVPCTAQLIAYYRKHHGCVIATRKVEPDQTHRFGILGISPADEHFRGSFRVRSLVERPAPDAAPSLYGVFGRYILEPGIFTHIAAIQPGFAGELQLTDALSLQACQAAVYAYEFAGDHYDAGTPLGSLQASLAYSVKDPLIAAALQQQLYALLQSSSNVYNFPSSPAHLATK
jgi:UTP--glucose-1-phosphate uridylyltransferase